MKTSVFFLLLFVSNIVYGQTGEPLARATKQEAASTAPGAPQQVVIVTGARFSYKLVQRWIDDYNKVNPDVQIIIESRGSSDPAKFDVLAEVYEHDQSIKDTREYIYVARYAVLPVATKSSEFARIYTKKGLTEDLIRQLYFHDMFADEEAAIKTNYTVYTRLQKAGVPIVFTRYFGYEQKDIKGKAIAGSDEHLLRALLKDSTGISYLPLPLIYDKGSVTPGLAVIPVDIDGNGRISDEEKFYDSQEQVLRKLESIREKDLKNIPVEYLHLSVSKKNASPEAIAFLQWISAHADSYLTEFGYLKPDEKKSGKDTFQAFASKRSN